MLQFIYARRKLDRNEFSNQSILDQYNHFPAPMKKLTSSPTSMAYFLLKFLQNMKNIYIIFNNIDFKPVFVGSSESNTASCIKSVFSDALNEKKDVLSKWVNEQWQNNKEVLFHELHHNLNNDEAKHYEKEWRKSLSNLLKGKSIPKITKKEEKLIAGLKEIYSVTS